MRIKIDQSEKDGLWYVNYNGDNNVTMADTEGYDSAPGAARAVDDFFKSAGQHIVANPDGSISLSLDVTITDDEGMVTHVPETHVLLSPA